MENYQLKQLFEPHVSKESIEEESKVKEESESESNGSNVLTSMESTPKVSGKEKKLSQKSK